MAVGNFQMAELHIIDGVKLAVQSAGIKKIGKKDTVLIELNADATLATAFTQNLFCAAPVQICKKHLAQKKAIRYLLINSGNANAGTGSVGFTAAQQVIDALAKQSACEPEQILVFSTGVIGQPLPSAKMINVIPQLYAQLSVDGWQEAAQGIMTTDTYAKAISKQVEIGGKKVSFTGIAKGVGMIKPNMATLLAFVATDAQLPPALLQQLLTQALNKSLNSITVDGDTSTNDSCVLIATGKSGCAIDGHSEDELAVFQAALEDVFIEIAHVLIRDGEGATKFVEVQVEQGKSVSDCKKIAFKIADSPLVKTALFASDPNWGRILAAIGNAGVELDVSKIDLFINDVRIVEQGGLFHGYREEQGVIAMAPEDITIRVLLNDGDASSRVWTTDLSYDYVKINAEYRS